MAEKPEKFKETILLLADKLEGFQCAFRGTTSLVLQGLDMDIDDIDILCDEKTALACNEILKDFVIEEVSYQKSPQFKSFFGQFKINEIQVEIMGEWQIKDSKGNWSRVFNASDQEREEISFEGKNVFVTLPELELASYSKMGRWNAYHKLKKQLTARNQPSLFR